MRTNGDSPSLGRPRPDGAMPAHLADEPRLPWGAPKDGSPISLRRAAPAWLTEPPGRRAGAWRGTPNTSHTVSECAERRFRGTPLARSNRRYVVRRPPHNGYARVVGG